MSESTQPNGSDAPFDNEHDLSIPLNPDDHPAESVDRMLTETAKEFLNKADEALERGDDETGVCAILLADEFNQRRAEPEELPINRDLATILDGHAAATVDKFLAGIVHDLTLMTADDPEMNAHIDEMRKEVAARVRGGDA